MPGPGGWSAFGIPWEEGRELPVGFSKKWLLVDRITQNCALCHTSQYRVSAEAKPVIVPGGTNHMFRFDQMLDFIESAANDSRFSADILLPAMQARFKFNVFDKVIYRFLVIPLARKEFLKQIELASFRKEYDRPEWGPGRDAAFNLAKFIVAEIEDDGSLDTTDFATLWNLGARQGHSLNWAGETPDALAVITDSALAFGVVPGAEFSERRTRIYNYLASLQAPDIPDEFAPSDIDVEKGKAVFDVECASCHALDGSRLGKVVPIAEIATDENSFNAWSQSDADRVNKAIGDLGFKRTDLVKAGGYVSVPLDGLWLRAPYLHNGSVPNLRQLLTRPEDRVRTFFKGCDVIDGVNVGFIADASAADICPNAASFDTRLKGNGNQGHDYGTALDENSRKSLIAYLKTL
jgi:mono/diheme cytochrome c family protein